MSEASADHAPGEARRKLPPLHEIVTAYCAVLTTIDEAEGEVSDADAKLLDELGLTLGEKAEVLAMVHSDLIARSIAALAVAKPYMDRAAKLKANADKIKERTFEAMQAAGLTRVVGPTGGGARIQKNSSPSVVIHEGATVPPSFCKPAEPDLKRIGNELKAGAALDFAELQTGTHLRWV